MTVTAEDQPSAEEQELIERWQHIKSHTEAVGSEDPRPAWFRDANLFLRRQAHWWCRHAKVTAAMAETLQHHDKPPVQVCLHLIGPAVVTADKQHVLVTTLQCGNDTLSCRARRSSGRP